MTDDNQVTYNVGERFPEIKGVLADDFTHELLRLQDQDCSEIILDFAGTTQMNSMAMGSVFSLYRTLKDQQRSLKMVNVSERIVRLLKMANLTDLLG